MPRELPLHPGLDRLTLEADELHREHLRGDPAARAGGGAGPLTLGDARRVIAREYGFTEWPQLAQRVERTRRWAALRPHPRFAEAVAALDAVDLPSLRALVAADPGLLAARGALEPPFGYFTGATLLHHVAGNPTRGPLRPGIVDAARWLLEAGAAVDAETLGEHGGTTMDLVITSEAASEAGVSGPLIELLLRFGAKLDLASPGALDAPLANHAPRAAEKMIELGAPIDLCAAAALGRCDLLAACLAGDGALVPRPRLSQRCTVGLALLFAYVNGREAAVDLLLAHDGDWNMIGVNNGTALHRAAGSGDLAMVERLVAKGADPSDRNNPFHATPYSWADHEHRDAVCVWMRAHTRIDLHDAVCFDLADHARARLAEDPQCVDALVDQWELPRCTALHHAARLNRVAMVELLLAHGARAELLAGDGRSALAIAEQAGASEVARILVQRARSLTG